MSVLVMNAATRSCCGSPADAPCSCSKVEKPVPLGLPTMNFEPEPPLGESVVSITNNRPANGIGLPEWSFDSQPEPPAENRGDKPKPLGVPEWTF